MKIYVSKDLFGGEFEKFKTPMEKACGTFVDETLKLGEIIIEDDNGIKTLITMNVPNNEQS